MHRVTVITSIALLLTACATGNVFRSYPSQASQVKQGLSSDNYTDARDWLSGRVDSSDAELYLMELGRVDLVAGEAEQSKASFEQAIGLFQQRDMEARVRLSRALEGGTSLFLNDNALPYRAPFYEQVMTHHYQALNYWRNGNLEGAGVEFRRARLVQNQIAQHYEKEIADANSSANENGVSINEALKDYPGISEAQGAVKQYFHNAYTFYLSGAFWEAIGEYNDALVDYKKALEINPTNEQLLEDVRRVERRAPEAGKTRVWVFIEQGFVQERQAFKLSVPTHNSSLVSLSVPYYPSNTLNDASVMLKLNNEPSVFAPPISDMNQIAAKELRAQMPFLMTRQVLRGFAKHALQRQAGDRWGDGAKFLVNIVNLVTEQADLRSWLSLPSQIQAYRFDLEPGDHTIDVMSRGHVRRHFIEAKPGKTYFFNVMDLGGAPLVHQYLIQ